MYLKNISYIITILFISIFSFSCEEDDPVVPNEEELITTLTYTLVPDNLGAPVVFNFQDLDGDGGNAPVVTNGVLSSNTSYSGLIELLDETETPAENITTEVADEATEHQFFFQPTDLGTFSVSYDDQDLDGNPLGIATSIQTGDAANGSLTIILRHEPDKNASGVANGDITNAGGETDIEVTFDVVVQ